MNILGFLYTSWDSYYQVVYKHEKQTNPLNSKVSGNRFFEYTNNDFCWQTHTQLLLYINHHHGSSSCRLQVQGLFSTRCILRLGLPEWQTFLVFANTIVWASHLPLWTFTLLKWQMDGRSSPRFFGLTGWPLPIHGQPPISGRCFGGNPKMGTDNPTNSIPQSKPWHVLCIYEMDLGY